MRTIPIIIAACCVALLTGFFYLAFSGALPQHQAAAQPVSPIVEQPTTAADTTQAPARLIIPDIGVNALVESKGLAADGTIGVPAGPSDVAWFNLGPKPGQQGTAIISGHFGPWKDGSGSVFDRLSDLQPGGTVEVVDATGKKLTFSVQSSRVYQSNETLADLQPPTDGKYLYLITCNGTWLPAQKTYTKRLVVTAQLAP